MNSRTCTIACRFSYLKVFSPNDGEIDNGKYTASLIIDKADTKSVSAVKTAMKNCYEENVGMLGKDMKKVKWCLNDGDTQRADDPAYANGYYINAKSKTQPGIVDANRQAIINSQDFISGDYGYACITFFPYSNSGNKGIGCSLRHVMKTRDGEPLADVVSVDDAFGGVEVGNTTVPQSGPVADNFPAPEFDPFATD